MARQTMWVAVLLVLAGCGGGSPPAATEADLDHDGYPASKDCNDNDATVHPGATEVPYDGIDQDCDGKDLTDVDGDGYDGGARGTDCNDNDATIHPDATEICGDGIDQNCSGDDLPCDAVDQDMDGYTPKQGDCDDHDATVHPGATEVPYNGKDDDCNPDTKDEDLDGDGYKHDVDCNDKDASIHPGATEIPYDGIDQDCMNGDLIDVDGDGVPGKPAGGNDCNDNDPSISPNLPETPYDGKDNDCNPATPDDDIDGDGYRHDKDCNDNDRTIHPGAREIPYDGIDQNCDGKDLTDVDQDGFDAVEAGGTDCDDRNAKVNPGQMEIPYNGVDDDCSPTTPDDDIDKDGFVKALDCDDNNADRYPGHVEVPYDGVDQDCDGKDLTDVDGDGQDSIKVAGGTDCNDNDATIYKGAKEIFSDGIDQDCDGLDAVDGDGDGYASVATGGNDCNDNDPAINPGAKEICGNAVDEDCSGRANICLYWKKGVQNDLDPADLDGWTKCYSNAYADDAADTIPPDKCNGKVILMACKQQDATKLRVAAMAKHDDVFTDTGIQDPALGGSTSTNSNGVEWYYHLQDANDAQPRGSWGFADGGKKVHLLYCDDYDNANGLPLENTRLCFGTIGNSWRGGYRCGDQLNLRSQAEGGPVGGAGTDWERIVYTSDEDAPQ